MIATSFEITGRKQIIPIEFADIKNFELRESGNIEAEKILKNPQITLFSLDFENARAIFVETLAEVDLSQAPFYYQTQRENALRVLTVPFEVMVGLAQQITLDDSKLIFIHSMGRSGSTLASKIFAQVFGVINMSEPDTLTQLVAARFMQPDQTTNLKMLLDASIRWLCKTPAETAWVIKGRSWAIELGDWLHERFPRSRNVYLYRDAESWSKSSLKAFMDNVERTPEELYQFEDETRGWMKLFVPLIAGYDPEQHLTGTGLLALMWLSNMGRYMELHKSGVDMLAIPYPSWQLSPLQTATSMLEYCGCLPSSLTAVEETLKKDSQEGTSVSQDAVRKNTGGIQVFNLEELNQHLQSHAFIKTPDYEAANTLKL
jgi:hypothetical protein